MNFMRNMNATEFVLVPWKMKLRCKVVSQIPYIVKMVAVVILLFYFYNFCDCSTHWVVTEDGKIQAETESTFNMKRPYDLVGMMQQEERVEKLKKLQNELVTNTDIIDRADDKDHSIEEPFYASDPDCIAAGKPLADFDLYISSLLPLENKGIRMNDHVNMNIISERCPGGTCVTDKESDVPICTDYMPLDYSIHAYEHLEGMKQRANLVGHAEVLLNAVSPSTTIEGFGLMVSDALKKNATSWVLYNMAAFYWRMIGNSLNGIECVRRALHLSPPDKKDVALISLGNILHQAQYSNDASVVVQAAVAISPDLNVNHFTLGNIYAILAQYNKSLQSFENTLRIQPDFQAASRRHHAILCHLKLEALFHSEHKRLQKTLIDLNSYQDKHKEYRLQQEKVLQQQVTLEELEVQRLAYNTYRDQSRNVHAARMDRDSSLTYDYAIKRIPTKHIQNIPKPEIAPPNRVASSPLPDQLLHPSEPKLYPKQNIEPVSEKPSDWPSKEECEGLPSNSPKITDIPSVYMPPSNKGFMLDALLSEYIGLGPGEQHPLPWYPPVCSPSTEKPNIADLKNSEKKASRKEPDDSLKHHLKKLVKDPKVTEEEIGQRILTALKLESISTKWHLYILAALYWLMKGNIPQALGCSMHAVVEVPLQYKDVQLTNLAGILYRGGMYKVANIYASQALDVNSQEPETHLIMGHTLWSKGNHSGAAYHYRQVLKLEPSLDIAQRMLLVVSCNVRFPPSHSTPEKDTKESCSSDKEKPVPPPKHKYVCKVQDGEEKCVKETTPTPPVEKGQCNNDATSCNCNQYCMSKEPQKTDSGDGESCQSCQSHGCHSSTVKDATCEQSGDSTICKLDEVGDVIDNYKNCEGDGCKLLHVARNVASMGQRSHIKLVLEKGKLKQRIIVAKSIKEVPVESHECVIYSDWSLSAGCSRPEYKHYVSLVLP